jgi:hypothetical protein
MKKTLKKIALVLMVVVLGSIVISCTDLLKLTVDVAVDVGNTVTEAKTAKSLYQTALKNDEEDTF